MLSEIPRRPSPALAQPKPPPTVFALPAILLLAALPFVRCANSVWDLAEAMKLQSQSSPTFRPAPCEPTRELPTDCRKSRLPNELVRLQTTWLALLPAAPIRAIVVARRVAAVARQP